MKPVMVGDPPSQKLQIGFVARRDIEMGEELFFNYGLKEKNIPWAVTDAKKVATKLPATTSVQSKTTPKKVTHHMVNYIIL